ncbi:hypothetical protein H9P43_003451 [Blastocladiella emersonii ATCC 22665]|nr:hypothetical protein H9P43_003451 [Blastocladiella emersonii ATCC 22665]
MEANLDSVRARAARLLAKFSPSTTPSPSSLPTVRHLFRLLPLTFPPPSLFLSPPSSPETVRVVAVTELGLHPRGTLTAPTPLAVRVLVGRLEGSTLHGAREVAIGVVEGSGKLSPVNGKGEVSVTLTGRVEGEVGEAAFLEISVAHGATGEEVRKQFGGLGCMPVVLGPFPLAGECNEDEVVDMYRVFEVPPPSDVEGGEATVCLIREDWGLGIPGKVWDSAVVLSHALISSTSLPFLAPPPATVLDLSSGTGHLAALLRHRLPSPTTRVVCTDLPEALPLLRANLASLPNVHCAALPWGETTPADVLVCSDVLYEREFFAPLAKTIAGCGPRAVLAYKPRGLSEDEEDVFFERMLMGEHGVRVERVLEVGVEYGVLVMVLAKKKMV